MNMLEWVLCFDRLPNDSRAYMSYGGNYKQM